MPHHTARHQCSFDEPTETFTDRPMSRHRNRKSKTHRTDSGAQSIKQPVDSLVSTDPLKKTHSSASGQKLPTVSICTVTSNRQKHLALLQTCVSHQTYPHDLLEWVILDDSDNNETSFTPDPALDIQVQHIKIENKLILSDKRNRSHDYCRGEIIVYMDDDDYYHPDRVSHAVERLLQTGRSVAGCTILPIFFTDTGQAWIAGPFGENHATANTFAFRRELLKTTRYQDAETHAEEKAFLKNYQIPMAQLNPALTILCMGHSSNTFDKRKLIHAGKNPKMRKARNMAPDFISKETLDRYINLHANGISSTVNAGANNQTHAIRGNLLTETRTLDLGCGASPRNPFQANQVCGVDVNQPMRPDMDVRLADLAIDRIPWEDSFFNYITAYDFIEHVPRVIYAPHRRLPFVELMNEIWRCLKTDGIFLSSTPAYPKPEAFQDPTHVNIITERTFTHYFSGPYWARMYGFKGFFKVESQEWEGYALKTVMRKLNQ